MEPTVFLNERGIGQIMGGLGFIGDNRTLNRKTAFLIPINLSQTIFQMRLEMGRRHLLLKSNF